MATSQHSGSSNNNNKRNKKVDCLNTNVLSLAGISTVGWSMFTFTSNTANLQQFLTSVVNTSTHNEHDRYQTPVQDTEFLSCINDPIITNQVRLLEAGIPCVWRYVENQKKSTTEQEKNKKINIEIVYPDIKREDNQEITRELWVFWLNHESKPDLISQIEGSEELAGSGHFDWQQLEASSLQYDLFIKAFKNLINRALVKQEGVPLGEWCAFPTKSNKTVDEGILSCKFEAHLSPTSLIFQPVVKYRKIRTLQNSDLKNPQCKNVILAPSGLKATILPENFVNRDNAAVILMEFEQFFKLDVLDSSEPFDPSLPGLVNVRINHGTFQRDVPYPARYIYVITSNETKNIDGIIPGIGKSVTAMDEMLGQPGNFLLSLLERKTESESDIGWWCFSNYLNDVVDSRTTHKHKNSKDVPPNSATATSSSSSAPETTMTPNTPGGIANDATNSPGKPQTPQTRNQSGAQPAHETYPSPLEEQSSSREDNYMPDTTQPVPEDVMLPGTSMFYNSEDYSDEDEADFDFFNEGQSQGPPGPLSTTATVVAATTNTCTPTPDLPGSVRVDETFLQDTPGVHQSPLPRIRRSMVPDLSYTVKHTSNPLVPPRWAPLIFSNDDLKYPNDSPYILKTKRKFSESYVPDYRPKFLPRRKKARKEIKKEVSEPTSEDDSDEEPESCGESENSDSGGTDVSITDQEKDEESHTRTIEFINSARFIMLIDQHNLRKNFEFKPFAQITEDEHLSKKAVYLLRDHIVYGSYPFAGEGGETTRKILERQRRLNEAFNDELPTSPAYPSEVVVIIDKLKRVLEYVSSRLPATDKNGQVNVNGPLKVQEYCRLNEPQHRYQNQKFVSKTKNREPNYQSLEPRNLVVGFKGKYVEVSTDQLRFWERHKLEPPEGKKNVTYFVLHPDNSALKARVMTLFEHVDRMYKNCELGLHQHGILGNISAGLIPVQLVKAAGETDLDRALKSYDNVCQQLGEILVEVLRQKREQGTLNQIIIYIINPFTHSTAYFDICKKFAWLQMHMKQELKKRQLPLSFSEYVTLQIVPIDHVIKFNNNGGTHKQGLLEMAFSAYTRVSRPSEYVPPYMLRDPEPIAIHFKQEDPSNCHDLIESGLSIHMAYGYTPDGRWMVMVSMDNVGNILHACTLPCVISSGVEVPCRTLLEESLKRVLQLKKSLEGCNQIIITKLGPMSAEERRTLLEITESKTVIVTVVLDPCFGPVDVSHDDQAQVCGIVLNNPIPRNGYRPIASGYMLEVASDRGPLATIQVDLLNKPSSPEKSDYHSLWEVLREFHSLSRLDTTPVKINCLPLHIVLVERLTRALLGIAS